MKRYIALMGLLLAAGCELPDTSSNSQDGSQAAATAGGTSGSSTSSTDAEWNSIQWHGESCAGATQVMTLSASISGDNVQFSWNTWPWGSNMGLGHFFWWNGTTWQGGKFDWIRAGGQSVKGLVNIREGYNGLSVPASGTAVAFAWTSADGSQRSNLARTTWP